MVAHSSLMIFSSTIESFWTPAGSRTDAIEKDGMRGNAPLAPYSRAPWLSVVSADGTAGSGAVLNPRSRAVATQADIANCFRYFFRDGLHSHMGAA